MSGVNLFLKYAYAPNVRGFCGPRDIAIIHEGLMSNDATQVTEINLSLSTFTGALPYLQLIASSNHIRDPFNSRVVEAYWIGNDLLNYVSVAKLYDHLRDRFRPKINLKTINLIASQAIKGAKPHHSYHVFDAFSKTGGFDQLGLSDIILNRIDECRIGWGVFEKYIDTSKSQIEVRYQPIENQKSKIKNQKRKSKVKIIENKIDNYQLFTNLKRGDLVTFHWSRICDRISQDQANRLNVWTNYHLRLSQTSFVLTL